MKERIKQARLLRKYSQKKLADIIGISDAALSKIESGKNNPSKTTLKAIADALDVSLDWLKTGDGSMMRENETDTLDTIARRYSDSKIFRALLDVYAQLSAEGQDAVEHYIALLSKALEEGRDPATVDPLKETIDPDEDFHSAAQHARDVLPSDEPDGDTKAHA